jgi:hypothetical protein
VSVYPGLGLQISDFVNQQVLSTTNPGATFGFRSKSAVLLSAGMKVATGGGMEKLIIRHTAAAKPAVRQRIREYWNKQWEREALRDTQNAWCKRQTRRPSAYTRDCRTRSALS